MGCTISKKTFNINLTGTNISHKLTVHSTSNGNNHVLQIQNNGKSIQWKESTGATHDKFGVISFGSVVVPLEFTDIAETVKVWYWPGGFFWKPPNRIRLYIDDVDTQDGTHISERTSSAHCCREFCPSYLTLLGLIALFILIGIISGAYGLIYCSMIPVIVLVMVPCCIGGETFDAPDMCDTTATPTYRAYTHPIIQLLSGNTIPERPVKPMENNSKPAQSELPVGWTKLYTNDGRAYYQNDQTQKTQWECPKPVNNVAGYQKVAPRTPVTPNAQTVVIVMPDIDDSDLPNGWSVSKTPDGKILYVNDKTGKTQWEKPTANNAVYGGYEDKPEPNRSEKQERLPPGWVKVTGEDGRVYYQNNNTKTTHWELPPHY